MTLLGRKAAFDTPALRLGETDKLKGGFRPKGDTECMFEEIKY